MSSENLREVEINTQQQSEQKMHAIKDPNETRDIKITPLKVIIFQQNLFLFNIKLSTCLS